MKVSADNWLGLQYGRLIGVFLFVPRYMMEHSNFGYRETDFLVKLGGEPACLGTLIKALRSRRRGGVWKSRMLCNQWEEEGMSCW